jgi:hypothetical protein
LNNSHFYLPSLIFWELRVETLGDLAVAACSNRLSPLRFFREPNIINPITIDSGIITITTSTNTGISTSTTTKISASFPAFFSFRCSG